MYLWQYSVSAVLIFHIILESYIYFLLYLFPLYFGIILILSILCVRAIIRVNYFLCTYICVEYVEIQ